MSTNIKIKEYRNQIIEAKKELHDINFTANAKRTIDMVKKARKAKIVIAKMTAKISEEIKKVAK